MHSTRRWRAVAVTPTACVSGIVLLSLVMLASSTPAAAVGDELRQLTLEPFSGPPGVSVTAIADGFGACPPGRDDVGDGEVVILWDGEAEVAREVTGNGSARTTFVVPLSASLEEHRVVARCDAERRMVASTAFIVTAPTEPPVLVPGVVGMSLDDATSALSEAQLSLGRTTGEGGEVQRQTPSPGTEVERGTSVDLELGRAPPPAFVVVPDLRDRSVEEAERVLVEAGLELGGVSGAGEFIGGQSPRAGLEVPPGSAVDVTVTPFPLRLVTVPDLRGADIADVPAVLDAAGLVLGPVTGEGDTVASQEPGAGAEVLAGSVVSVSVEPSTPPVATVSVPDLEGLTLPEARRALSAVGLELADVPASGLNIASQQPAAGTLVPVGSPVSVVLAPPAEAVPWTTAGALVVLVAAAVIAQQVMMRRQDRRWVRRHVQVTTGSPRAPRLRVDETSEGAAQASHAVRLDPRPDPGTHVLEEAV